MPGYDQTGPAGYGSRTGRGFGPCRRGMAFSGQFTYGCGRGFGRGRGFGHMYYANYVEPELLSKEAHKQLLEAELKRIEAKKTEIERRFSTLE
jgi:hypothetical protein